MAKTETFGGYLRERRLRAGFGLRGFAEALDMKPSNLSAIEHGRQAPLQDATKLAEIGDLLGLQPGSEDRARLFDLAVAGRGRLAADVAEFAARTPAIPVLLRTIENRGLSQEELERLTAFVSRKRRMP